MPQRISTSVSQWGRWMALSAALLGWLFDGLEMGMFSLVGRPALRELLNSNDEARIGAWFGIVTALFLVGAATGGVLFGWLGDRVGRVRAMTLSIFIYAIFTGACAFAGSPYQFAVFRTIASLGMGGEWSLGVALVMELWSEQSRTWLAGLIGAAANFGYLLIALVGLGFGSFVQQITTCLRALGVSQPWIDELTRNQAWRLVISFGLLPALLTIFIQLFVPESETWQQQSQQTAKHWASRDLLAVLAGALCAVAIVYLWAAPVLPLTVRIGGTLLGLTFCAIGYLYPVIRFTQRSRAVEPIGQLQLALLLRQMLLAAAVSGVALLGTWASLQWAPTWADQLTDGQVPAAKSWTQFYLSLGAILGTLLAAPLAEQCGRRASYRIMCLLSFGSILILYQTNHSYGPQLLASACLAGGCTAMFYGWLPLYLPELFPTSVRATGQGFAFNFGRILAAIGALQTGNLMTLFQGSYVQACSLMSLIYLVGLIIIGFAPETRGQTITQ